MVTTAALVRRDASSTDADELVNSVHEVMLSVLHRARPALEAEGISKVQFWALHLVSKLGSASLSNVARHLALAAPTICATVDDLEASGLVQRHRSERDHRTVELTLTVKGRKVEARVWSRIGRLMADASADLPQEDLRTAVRVFRELSRRLEATGKPAGGVA